MLDVGIDIENIERFQKYAKTDRFVKLCFTDYEIEYCYSQKNFAKHLAVRFCAKEALIKSLPREQQSLNFVDIEIRNDPQSGKPEIFCSRFKDYEFKVSMSHDKDKAIAIVCRIK